MLWTNEVYEEFQIIMQYDYYNKFYVKVVSYTLKM